jgi:hypothetical protein
MSDVSTELLAVRLRFVRAERAKERQRRRGLRAERAAFLDGVCRTLVAEIEAAGMAHVRAALQPGLPREIAGELVELAAAGLGYEGLPLRPDELPVFASTQLAPILATCASRTQRLTAIQQAVRATFDFVVHGPTLCLWPLWLPKAIGRAAAAHLAHRLSEQQPPSSRER